MSNYTYIQLEPSHLPQVCALYNQVFKRHISVDELAMLFDTHLFGKYTIGFLAFSPTGELAAYYGVFPIQVLINGATLLAAQSGATMTHPNHQKKGLFVELAKRTYDEAARQGVSFVYGFPNENSLPGFQRKLNWAFYGNIRKFTMLTSNLPLCELASKNKILEKIYLQFVSRRLNKLKSPNFQSADSSQNKILKSSEFLKYKLKTKSNFAIEINGFHFLIKTSPHLMIADVSYFTPDLIDSFIKTIFEIAQLVKARKIVLQLSPNHWLTPLLEAKTPHSTGLTIGFLALNGQFQFENFQFTFADFDTY